MSYIDSLKEILPAPDIEVGRFNEKWKQIEEKFAIELPVDFKQFIEIYGTGKIDDFVWILNPLSANENLNFDTAKYFIDAYETSKSQFPDDYLRPKYPEDGSFFPWAATENGDSFVWIVSGKPDEWTVAVFGRDQENEELRAMGCVEFVYRLLKKELSSKILPIDFPTEGHEVYVFEPHSE